MFALAKRVAIALLVCAPCFVLNGCLISGLSGGTVAGITSGQATITLQRNGVCTVDTTAVSTTCNSSVSVLLPGGSTQTLPVTITLLGIAAPLPLYDPLILEVPASMSNFAGSIAVGPPGVAPDTPLAITAGLTSIPIDAHTNLVAEPGTQLVIIDFQAPENAPFGEYTLKIQFSGTASSFKALFAAKVTVAAAAMTTKAAQTYYVPIYPCVTSMAAVPAISLPLANLTQLIPTVISLQACVGKLYDFTGVAASPLVDVIEYYNASLDHYFITWVPAEIAILDAGVTIRGWTRTGKSFKAYNAAQPGTSDICRYYIPPALGDSHFFGRGTVECNATGQRNPTFVLEDPKFMQMFLPNLGNCPAGTTEVYRVFSNRPDANHRYMTDPAVRAQMVAAGWLAEGDGPNLVVMCAPTS